MNNCQLCDTLVIKYKHYKKKLEREKESNNQLRNEIQQKAERIKELEFLCTGVELDVRNGRARKVKSEKDILGPEINWLGSEMVELVARNEELELKLQESVDRNNDLKNCLMIAQGRKLDLQSTLLSNMRVYEKSLEDSVLEGERANSNDLQLMQQLFSVQENIEKILLSEVAYLREVVSAQQHVIASPSGSPLRSSNHLPPQRGSYPKDKVVSSSPIVQNQHSRAHFIPTNEQERRNSIREVIEQQNQRIEESLDERSRSSQRFSVGTTSDIEARDGKTASILSTPNRLKSDGRLSDRCSNAETRSRSRSSTEAHRTATSRSLSPNHNTNGWSKSYPFPVKSSAAMKSILSSSRRHIAPEVLKSPGMKTRRWATAALQAEVDNILRDISGIIV